MPVDWHSRYASRIERMRASDIREILKVTAQPDVISLAGGLPAPELFPVDEFRRAFEWVFESDGQRALQYSTTEGYAPLREFLAGRLGRVMRIQCSADDILITNGSQQALDLMGKIFLDPGDHVLLENPSYLGAIQAFNQYQPGYSVVPMDDDGILVDALERILEEDRGRSSHRIKFLYAIPTFQNPTGRTLTLERRKKLVEICSRYGVPVVEDDPYGELRYEGEPLPTLKSLDRDGTVIYMGTFSKILAPGWRLGWVVAAPDALEHFNHAKQPSDLQTATAPQMATYEVVKDGFVDKHVQRLIPFYRERRDVMIRAMEEHFPSSVKFTRPMGGLFSWAELPANVNTRDLLADALQEKVAFVPGQGFHPDGSGQNTMRLNFSNVPPEKLQEGIRRLGRAIQARLERGPRSERTVAV